MQRARVIVESAQGRAYAVAVEVAQNDFERSRGLMFREKLGLDEGMLFLFSEERLQAFWMKNTLIPLDMLFIDSQLRIVGIVENAEPQTLTQRAVARPSQYVLEVNGGWCAQKGVKAGDRVRFEGVPR
jgi:uncharacterized membrane protein (UPF0127 family)